MDKKVRVLIILLIILPMATMLTGCEDIINLNAKILYAGYENYQLEWVGRDKEGLYDVYEMEIDGIVYRNDAGKAYHWQPILYLRTSVVGISDFNGVTLVYKTTSPWCYDIVNVISNRTPDNTVYNTEVDPSFYAERNEESEQWHPSTYVSADQEQFNKYHISGYSYIEGEKGIGMTHGEIYFDFYYEDSELLNVLTENLEKEQESIEALKKRMTDPEIIENGIPAANYMESEDDVIRTGMLYLFSNEESLKGLCMKKEIFMLADMEEKNRYIARTYEGNTYYVDVTDLLKK